MKNYTITVNGNVYDVTVEEKGAGTAPAPAAPAPAPVPKAAPAPAPAPKAAGAGKNPGKGRRCRKGIPDSDNRSDRAFRPGDAVVVIEAMKMEIPVVAPEAGTIASIDVAVGDAVEAGAVLATLN